MKRTVSEQVDCGQRPRRPCRRHRFAKPVYRRVGTACIRRIDAGKIPEDALPRIIRQSRTDRVFALEIALPLKQDHKKSFLLDNRTAQPRAVLIAIVVILFNPTKVVEPATGIKRGIVVRPKCGSVKFVCSRTRHHADLSDTARGLGIHRSCHDLDFFYQIGTRIG